MCYSTLVGLGQLPRAPNLLRHEGGPQNFSREKFFALFDVEISWDPCLTEPIRARVSLLRHWVDGCFTEEGEMASKTANFATGA